MSDVVHKLIVAAAMTTLRSRLLSESTLVGICFLLSVSYHVLCTPCNHSGNSSVSTKGPVSHATTLLHSSTWVRIWWEKYVEIAEGSVVVSPQMIVPSGSIFSKAMVAHCHNCKRELPCE
jgi:hypothetical protein